MRDKLEGYLTALFQGYARDPADSDYQRGYLTAMVNVNVDMGLHVHVPPMVRSQTYQEPVKRLFEMLGETREFLNDKVDYLDNDWHAEMLEKLDEMRDAIGMRTPD